MIKSIAITLLKFIFAFSIIGWMVYNGKLDFSIINSSLKYKSAWIIAFSIMIINIILTTIRWKLLLQIKSSTSLKISTMTRLTWIGVFFSSILPGVVTGDVVKLIYAKDLDENLSKTYLLTSAVLDRIIGLIGLLILVGISSAIYYQSLAAKGSAMTNLMHMNFLIFAGVILFLSTLILPPKIQNFFHNLFDKIPLIGKVISKIATQLWEIGQSPKTIILTLFISLIVQALNIVAFWVLVTPFIHGVVLSLPHAFAFIPLGFIATALPISPAGIGVGHAVFDQLFNLFNIKNGASLFNLYFICWISINLIGVIPYLMSNKKHSIKEASEFEAEPSA